MNEQSKLLTIPEVAARLGLGRSKIYDHLGKDLPVVRFGRSVRVTEADLRSFIDRNRQPTKRREAI